MILFLDLKKGLQIILNDEFPLEINSLNLFIDIEFYKLYDFEIVK